MHRTPRTRFCKLFQVPDGTGAGGPAGGSASPPAAPPAALAPGSAPAGPASGVPGSGAGPGAGGAAPAATPEFKFAEDRSKWIPPYRLDEERQERERLSREYDRLNQKVRALMGVEEPADPRRTEIRNAILQVFPELQSVVSGELQGGVRGAAQAEQAYWGRHASTMTQNAVDALAKELGQDAKAMGPQARSRMAAELQRFIASDRTGERNDRYEQGDPTLIDELIADLRGFYVEPVRRSAGVQGASAAERVRRLPSTGPSGGIPPTPAADKPKGKALHEAARQDFLARIASGQ